ncbi:unnamed protein product, partial [Amoebophrya sp. A120]|eukprot:GSA120T00023896001.1
MASPPYRPKTRRGRVRCEEAVFWRVGARPLLGRASAWCGLRCWVAPGNVGLLLLLGQRPPAKDLHNPGKNSKISSKFNDHPVTNPGNFAFCTVWWTLRAQNGNRSQFFLGFSRPFAGGLWSRSDSLKRF